MRNIKTKTSPTAVESARPGEERKTNKSSKSRASRQTHPGSPLRALRKELGLTVAQLAALRSLLAYEACRLANLIALFEAALLTLAVLHPRLNDVLDRLAARDHRKVIEAHGRWVAKQQRRK